MTIGISNFVFLAALVAAIYFFSKNVNQIRKNIALGRDTDRSDRKQERWANMARVAMGQSKMQSRPVAGFFHFVIYAGFILINIEVLEILLDGLLGTHRLFAPVLGGFYPIVIGFFEILAVLVIVACVVFLYRRNVAKIPRFHAAEMQGWPFKDANTILYIEIVLMTALLGMNAVDINGGGPFLISGLFAGIFSGVNENTLAIIERTLWWIHILGIFAFLNYLPFSKHFHIILAFPNTWYAKLTEKGAFDNLESVQKQVALMMDPDADPYAAPAEEEAPERFGAKDVMDLKWVNLLNAYTCTECGRCTAECPANQTGKLLSPRKIMMDTRDRLDEVGANVAKNGSFQDDGKSLLDNYISREELWACTTCNACAEACPINIDPVDIIMQMRQYLVMEESAAPQELNLMMTNVENNGAPWQFSQADRLNWRDDN